VRELASAPHVQHRRHRLQGLVHEIPLFARAGDTQGTGRLFVARSNRTGTGHGAVRRRPPHWWAC